MASKGNRQKNRNNRNGNRDIMGVLLIIFSLFFLLCIVIPPILSVVSRAIFNMVLGVFGIMAYPMLIAMFLWGVFILLRRTVSLSRKNIACIVLLILFGMLILQLASTHAFLKQNFSDYISDVYAAKYSAGGVVFGTIAYGIKSLITEIGSYILFSAAILIVVAVMANVVARIRARKAPTAPVAIAKPAPKRGFADVTEARGVVPVDTPNKLFVGSIDRREPAIRTEAGTSSDLPPRDGRRVTDYGPSSVIEKDEPDSTHERYSAEAARYALYGDTETINEIELEEFNNRTSSDEHGDGGYGKQSYSSSASSGYAKADDRAYSVRENLAEPYMRVNEDAKNNPAKPRKIEHDAPNLDVCFPVPKKYEFNDEDIISADDVKARLQADIKRRKLSDMESQNVVPDRPQFNFTDIAARNEVESTSRFEPIDDIFSAPEPDYGVIDGSAAQSVDNGSFGTVKPAAPREEVREEIIDAFEMNEKYESDSTDAFPSREAGDDSDIINADVSRQSYQSRAGSANDNDESIIIDGSAPIISSVTPAQTYSLPADNADVDAGIIDTMSPQDDRSSAPEPIAPISSGITISDEPAIDMSETHDITSDIIDGGETSGMYVSADGFGEEKPQQKPKSSSKRNGPIDNQITFDNVIRESAEESVVVADTNRRKRYDYQPPPIDLLKVYDQNEASPEDLQNTVATLERVIGHFLKTEVKVKEIVPGPTVTRYELELPSGIPVKQIESHVSDIEYELAASSKIRIEAPIPGKRAVGIEVPNHTTSIVGLREIIQSPEFQKAKSPMTFSVGKDISGAPVLCDLVKVPHLLIAGQTGSGKSACLNGLIVSLLYKSSPEDLRFILVDPKRVEFAAYKSMPHLLFNGIIFEPDEVLNALKWACVEMERRYALMAKYGKNQLASFNEMPEVKSGKLDKLPHIIIIVDELADIMASSEKRDIEDRIKVIAAKARASGIHLILATQRPSADVITGTIKTNLTSRIAFKVSGRIDSNIILDQQGAEALVGNGDMLFHPVGMNSPKRVQGSFIRDEEVATVIAYIKEHFETDFDDSAYDYVFNKNNGSTGGNTGGGEGTERDDPLMPAVLAMMVKSGQASTSGIQRRFSIGFTRAARMMDIFERMNYIGPSTPGSSKPREVLLTADKFKELYGKDVDDI